MLCMYSLILQWRVLPIPWIRFTIVVGLLLLALIPLTKASSYNHNSYRFIKKIHIDGDEEWDRLSLDPEARRLYVTHGDKVVVIDIDTLNVVGEIRGTLGVHGFAVAPDLGLGFSSDGRESKAAIVDLKTLKTVSKVNTGEGPDAIVYVPAKKEVYSFNRRSNSVTVFAATSGSVVATISLPGKPDSAVLDPRAGRIYSNLEDKSVVAVIDVETHKIFSTWPIAPGQVATAMAIDLDHHLLLLGCKNQLMAFMNSVSGKVVATVPIGKGVDAVAFDPFMRLAFSSNGEGTVTIVREERPDKFSVVQTLETARSARTMTLDPKTHTIYLVAAEYSVPGNKAEGPSRRRPAMVPGSLRILVYGPK